MEKHIYIYIHIYIYLYITVHIYIYIYVHTLFLHAVVHVDQYSSVFPLVHQEISSVCLTYLIILQKDLMSFPNLFDQFLKKDMFPTYLFMLSFGFISCPTFSQSISPVDHYSFSSVLQNFPNLLVHVIIGFHRFSHRIVGFIMMFHRFQLSVPSLYHQISSVFLTKVFIVPFIFISFLPPTCVFYHSSLDFIRFPQLLVHLIIGIHHFYPSIP